MRAGNLNRCITVQRLGGNQDAAGQQFPDDWVDFLQCWAWHKVLSGRSGLRGNVMVSITGNSWRIRYSSKHLQIDSSMRVIYGGRVFAITRVDVDYANREYIDLICEEGGCDG